MDNNESISNQKALLFAKYIYQVLTSINEGSKSQAAFNNKEKLTAEFNSIFNNQKVKVKISSLLINEDNKNNNYFNMTCNIIY